MSSFFPPPFRFLRSVRFAFNPCTRYVYRLDRTGRSCQMRLVQHQAPHLRRRRPTKMVKQQPLCFQGVSHRGRWLGLLPQSRFLVCIDFESNAVLGQRLPSFFFPHLPLDSDHSSQFLLFACRSKFEAVSSVVQHHAFGSIMHANTFLCTTALANL